MSATEIFIARQPIVGLDGSLFAYELLFRSGPENVFRHPDPERASVEGLETGVLGFGLDPLTGGRPAFINFSRSALLERLYEALPPGRLVVEVLEHVALDAEVLAACRAAQAAGYRLALDDVTPERDLGPILPFLAFVKADFLASDAAGRRAIAGRVAGTGVALLAEKVETAADAAEAAALGYRYLQGYHFARPELLRGADFSPSTLGYLRFLGEVLRPAMDFERLEAVIKAEPSISVKLLRYLNSAGFGWRYDVTSIRQAIRLLGERPIRKWASLFTVLTLAEDRPQPLVMLGLVRAGWLERVAARTGLASELDGFLAGLLSVVDAIVGRPIADVLAALEVPAPVAAALRTGAPPLGPLLAASHALEAGDWEALAERAAHAGVPDTLMRTAYAEAVAWAEETLR